MSPTDPKSTRKQSLLYTQGRVLYTLSLIVLESYSFGNYWRLHEQEQKIDYRVDGGFRFETILISHQEAEFGWIAVDNHF